MTKPDLKLYPEGDDGEAEPDGEETDEELRPWRTTKASPSFLPDEEYCSD